MFSMIIVIMAIALAVVLVLATLYFGGKAYARDSTRLIAQTVVNQADQIAAARQIARAEGRPIPEGAQVMLPPDLLSTMPVPPRAAYEDGTPSEQDWEYYLATSKEHFGLSMKLNQKTCMEINRSQGFIGIPAAWDGTSRMQCFGPTPIGYTFLYELPTTTPAAHQEVIDKSVETAKPDAPTVRPGYPRLCPDGTTIESGLCEGGAVEPPPAETPTEPPEGYWVVKASVSSYAPSLENEGFSKTCPAGGIDPTSKDVSPAPSLPGEPFSVDSAVDMEWQLPPNFNSGFAGDLERTWCIPAKEKDVPSDVAFPTSSSVGNVVNIVNAANPASAGINPETWTDAAIRSVVITANGVTWTVMSAWFGADTENSDNGDYLAMVGRKVAIGKTSNATATYFVNSPVINSNGVSYQNTSGTITFAPAQPPCVPPVSNAPLGTGGRIVDIKMDGYTSVMLKEDGSVWMAGAGWDYDFGNCSANNRHVWTRVATGVRALSGGVVPKVLMLKHDGSVWASSSDSPVHVKLHDGPVVAAEVVDSDSLAILKSDGTLWYKGYNWQGEGGAGHTDPIDEFIQVDSNVASISSSIMNIFYIKNDGSLWATGESSGNHLGATYPRSPSGWYSTPGVRPVKIADNVAAVHGSIYSTFYLKPDGSVYAAGRDLFGCGMFGTTPQTYLFLSFTRIADYIGPVSKIQTTGSTLWLQTRSGALYAAGCNDDGSFGDGTNNPRTTFTQITSGHKLFNGDGVAFIVDASDTLWAAGYNEEGQFGNGSTTSSKVYVPVQY